MLLRSALDPSPVFAALSALFKLTRFQRKVGKGGLDRARDAIAIAFRRSARSQTKRYLSTVARLLKTATVPLRVVKEQ